MDPTRRVVVVANRQPFAHERTPDGDVEVRRSTSGLVTASEPLVRDSHGVWVGHGSGSADREAVDRWDGVMVPPGDPDYRLRRVWLTADEEEGYYYGFANQGLWPLCHRVHVRPVFKSADFDTYWAINERFAVAVCDETRGERATVLVQDYHFALAPLMIASELPHSTVVAFWHIPWPTVRQLEICPWARYLTEGLLGSDLLGFQTPLDCAQFLEAAEHFLDAGVDRRRSLVVHRGRRTHVRSYAASVEWPCPAVQRTGSVADCAAGVRDRFGLRATDRLAVGVDRLDYTKGLVEKALAVERLLDAYPEFVDSFVLLQVVQPSRLKLPEYQALRDRLRQVVDRVNRRFATKAWRPIVLVEGQFDQIEVHRLLRAADICYVGSLHDGMNLVAKEFVSARDDERGVLVLSGFAGAAGELTDASIVNPYDIEQTANTLADALHMEPAVQADRMRRMRACVERWDARRWGQELLRDADTLTRVPAIALARLST